jgi:hypothetical protein
LNHFTTNSRFSINITYTIIFFISLQLVILI